MPSRRSSTLFSLDPVPEIHLARAPLEKVLTQVQFSLTPGLVSEAGEEGLAAALSRYPVRRRGQSLNVTINPGTGMIEPKAVSTLSFADPSQEWTVTVMETAVALETTAYDSRDDFCGRAREVFAAIAAVAAPPVVDRVGLRYIDRIRDGGDLLRLEEYINPRLRVLDGQVSDPLAVEHSVTDTLLRIADDERLKVRSGILPPGAAFDPVLVAIPEASWVLDLDVFTTAGGFTFEPDALEARLRRYADHVYSFFRWATTDEFQRAFRDRQPSPLSESAS
jgi:uncharacterized protein (TIGR04255 family)